MFACLIDHSVVENRLLSNVCMDVCMQYKVDPHLPTTGAQFVAVFKGRYSYQQQGKK